MSKSKRNTVDPDDIIGTFGADTARWFMLSDSPPERDVIWTEEGVQGAWRFVQRLWRLVHEAAALAHAAAPAARPGAFSDAALGAAQGGPRGAGAGLRGHRKAAFQRLRRPYLRIRQCAAGDARRCRGSAERRPRPPDLALGRRRSGRDSGATVPSHDAASRRGMLGGARPPEPARGAAPWPVVESDLLLENTVTLPVQVNGKKRADVTVARDAGNVDIEAAVLAARCGHTAPSTARRRKR